MTLSQLKRAYKKACRANDKAITHYTKLLRKLIVRDRNTGEYTSAIAACVREDGDIYKVTSYAQFNMDNRIYVIARRRGNKVWTTVAGEDVWQEAERIEEEMRTTGNAAFDAKLDLWNAGLTVDEIKALRAE